MILAKIIKLFVQEKELETILYAFETTKRDLGQYIKRIGQLADRNREEIKALETVNEIHSENMEKADLVLANLTVITERRLSASAME